LELKPVGLPAFPLDLNGNGRQGQEAMVRREMAGPHAELGGYQLVVNLQGFKVLEPNLPARGTGATVLQGDPLLGYPQTFQLAHIVANEIGAWGPGWQRQPQGWVVGGMAYAHTHKMLVGGPEIELKEWHRKSGFRR
jgi:hypothetical protein